jgi:hypothetical protein
MSTTDVVAGKALVQLSARRQKSGKVSDREALGR